MNAGLPITVLIAAKNEAVNIRRCLASLTPAERVILLDSQSTDGTDIFAREAGAEVVQFRYRGGYPKKRQWALSNLDLQSSWILLLDADETIPNELWSEIRQVTRSKNPCNGYLIKKSFHFLRRRFTFGGFSHYALLLFKRGSARFERLVHDTSDGLDMEVHERLLVDGFIGKLKTPLLHDDFKGLEAYIERHNKYSTWEARLRYQFQKTGRWGEDTVSPHLFGNAQERRRLLKATASGIPFEPQLWFLYHYLFCLGFLERRAGLIASKLRSDYISQIRAKMFELKVCENGDPNHGICTLGEPDQIPVLPDFKGGDLKPRKPNSRP
jgi:glycosyltransferase involved in cell wall biosynthesis